METSKHVHYMRVMHFRAYSSGHLFELLELLAWEEVKDPRL